MSTSWVEDGEKCVCRDYSFILADGGIAPSDLLPEGAVDLCDFRDKGRSSSVCARDRDGDARWLCRDTKLAGDLAGNSTDSAASSSICLTIEIAARR